MNTVTLALAQAFANKLCAGLFFTQKERTTDHNNDVGTFTMSVKGSPAYILQNLKKLEIKKAILHPKSVDIQNETSPMGCFILGITGVNNSASEKIPLFIKNKDTLQHIDTITFKKDCVDEYVILIFFRYKKTFQTDFLSVNLAGLDKQASLTIEMKKFANAN